jgi:hypothetical protein
VETTGALRQPFSIRREGEGKHQAPCPDCAGVSLALGSWSLVLSELSICTFDIQDMTVNFPHA